MSTMCMRPTDCLAGRRAAFGAHRGVRAAAPAPALAPRSPPMQQQGQHESQTLGMVVNSRAARGRANGQQQRRRRSPPATGSGSPPHKRVMENVVILRRGQVLMDVATAKQLTAATDSAAAPSVKQMVEEKAETGLAGKDAGAGVAAEARRGEQEKQVDGSVATAKQSSESVAAVDEGGAREAAAAETPVAADNVGAETKEEEPVVTTNQSIAVTTTEENEPEAAAGQSSAQEETIEPTASVDHPGTDTREKEAEAAEHRSAGDMKAELAATAAHQNLPLAKEEKAEQAYSGASFAAAPDPRTLPIPVRLLKLPRGTTAPRFHVLALDNDRAPAPTAAAA